MNGVIESIVTWLIANVFTWMAILAIALGCLKKPVGMNRYENTLRYLLLWFCGIAFTWSGIMHLCLPNLTAAKIGWAPSPFQFEVGLANLSVAVLGFMAYAKPERFFALTVILATAVFTVGAGAGHIYQIVTAHNHAESNAGAILYTDILVPLIMLVYWMLSKPAADTR